VDGYTTGLTTTLRLDTGWKHSGTYPTTTFYTKRLRLALRVTPGTSDFDDYLPPKNTFTKPSLFFGNLRDFYLLGVAKLPFTLYLGTNFLLEPFTQQKGFGNFPGLSFW